MEQQEGFIVDDPSANTKLADSKPANNKPNKWVASLMGFFIPPIGMLYVAQPAWAGIYFVGPLMIGFAPGAAPAFLAGKAVLLLAVRVGCAIHSYRFAARYPAERPRPRYSRWSGALGVFLLGLIPVVILARAFVVEPFRMPSGSMLPTISPGAYLAVKKWGYGHYGAWGFRFSTGEATATVNRGDIIVFDEPDNPRFQFTKRVIGLPGDKVTYGDDKRLVINGSAIPQIPEGDYVSAGPGAGGQRFVRVGETLDGAEYSVLLRPDAPWLFREHAFPFRDSCVYEVHGLTCRVPQGEYFVLGDNRDDSRDSRYWGFVPAGNIVGKVVKIW